MEDDIVNGLKIERKVNGLERGDDIDRSKWRNAVFKLLMNLC